MKTLQEIIDKGKRIVFFGGAGVSTESGIPDFRSVDGLYNQKYAYPPETILSDTFFYTHTEEFFDFYDLYYLLKTPHKISFLYKEQVQELESVMEGDVCSVCFNGKWFRGRDEFFRSGSIRNLTAANSIRYDLPEPWKCQIRPFFG